MEEQKKETGQEMENPNTEVTDKEEAQSGAESMTGQEAGQASGKQESQQTEADSESLDKNKDTESPEESTNTEGSDENTEAVETDAEDTDAEATDSKEEGEIAKQDGVEKKGFFKKNKKKDKKDEKIEELTDQVKRQMAEFDNFRKRTEKEKSQMYEIGAKSIIEKVLPVVDNFERGLAAVPEENKDDAFVDGMNKIYKQILTMLEEVEVKPIEAVGKEFDPNLHNAVMQTESEEYESGIVAQELQKGYMYRDSVVRHSMVAVVS